MEDQKELNISDISCKVCFISFDENLAPKMLECGHSLCSSCLSRVLRTSKKCAVCRQKMTKGTVAQYPTNFLFLSCIDAFKKLQIPEKLFEDKVFTLMKFLKSERKILMDEEDVMDDAVNQLEDISKKVDAGEKIDDDSKKAVCQFEKRFSHMTRIKSCYITVSMDMDSYENEYKYLYEIYKRVQNGERLYAVEQIKNEVKYGRVSVFGNRVLIHCLSQKPQDREEDIVTIWLQDVKKCLYSTRFCAFLNICCNEMGLQELIMIDLTASPLVPQFVRLCTGEFGSSYKGISFTRGVDRGNEYISILSIAGYNCNGIERKGQIDLISGADLKTECRVNELIVGGYTNCGFHVLEVTTRASYTNVIGKVSPPHDFKRSIDYDKENNLKVVDSGVILFLGKHKKK